MSERGTALRTVAVIGLGMAVLAAILYYASTVDGRPPDVLRIVLTQHLTGHADTALTTSSIEVDFSEPVDHGTAEAAFGISPSVNGSFSWSSASMTFTPAARLPLRTRFDVKVGAGVRDSVGNRMRAAADPFSFRTVGNPSVVASDPQEAARGVPLDSPIVVDFSTLMDTASVERALHLEPAAEVRLRWARERLTVIPLNPLDPNRRYTLTIGVAALDQAGTPLDQPFTLSFRTVLSSLRADTLVPADGVTGAAVNGPIAIVFDRVLDSRSVNDGLLSIDPAVAGSLTVTAVPGAAGPLGGGLRVLRFQPSGPLDPNTTYAVTLQLGLLGTDGAGLAAPITWSFTTGAPTATLSNQIVFVSDRAGIPNLWAMNPDGTNQRQVSAELAPVIDYAVAPDGRAFVIGDGRVLVWEEADGSARRVLTDAGSVEFDPAYSPDGGSLVFGRADPALGSGLGLWMRDANGSDPRPVQASARASSPPSPSIPAPVPLLRTPRISPDGSALAFVDDAGMVTILDLGTGRASSARFLALSEPIWLADGSGVLISGLTGGSGAAARHYLPGDPVPLLDPASFGLDAQHVAALRVVRLLRGSTTVETTAFGPGAARPAIDLAGRVAYLRLVAAGAEAGSPWLTAGSTAAGRQVTTGPSVQAGSVSFTPEPRTLIISRVASPDDVTPASSAGVWLVDVASGSARQVSADGWLPRWLP